ncbi:MAG: glutamine synthetase GlnII [Candidatus Neomarinimicrobiota bacterium]|nr:glutamine synthetase GlnII [Candidatus Neomarinimicrobiota bacterium]
MKIKAEYIWIDGYEPTGNLRSKTKILKRSVSSVSELPTWGFDGSSTLQAEGGDSDCKLKPVWMSPDPIRGGDNILVMCEVCNADGSPHKSNARAALVDLAEKFKEHKPWFGIEQEYVLMDGKQPAGWPEEGFPERPQGPYYCSVGSEDVAARNMVEDHLDLCLDAGFEISGINAEVMLGQWEYQVGPLPALEVCDQLWVARWLLERVGEDYGLRVDLHPKPIKGDWNGSGAHINYSTESMRAEGGIEVINDACEKLGQNIDKHIAAYGADNDQRLTGDHETCSISQFKYGVSDRGASIRIPMDVANDKKGYLEDRRPASNVDPYKACAALIDTTCS